LSERHILTCDGCGMEEDLFCDGRGSPKIPRDWDQESDSADYCPDCVEQHAPTEEG
jgi:hypothetical protein